VGGGGQGIPGRRSRPLASSSSPRPRQVHQRLISCIQVATRMRLPAKPLHSDMSRSGRQARLLIFPLFSLATSTLCLSCPPFSPSYYHTSLSYISDELFGSFLHPSLTPTLTLSLSFPLFPSPVPRWPMHKSNAIILMFTRIAPFCKCKFAISRKNCARAANIYIAAQLQNRSQKTYRYSCSKRRNIFNFLFESTTLSRPPPCHSIRTSNKGN
jgi:hypothetical protein